MLVRSRVLAAVITLSGLAAAGSPVAQEPQAGFADPVLGRWDLTITGADGETYPSWLEVNLRKETQLQGRFVGRSGSVRHATEISFTNGELSFVVPVQYERHKSDLRFTGRLAGDKLEGTTQDAEGRTIAWTGVRAPATKPIQTVSWGTPIELFDGKSLSGWRPRNAKHAACWSVQDGLLTNTPPCTDLVTERAFDDFKLHAEFKYPPKSNSGIYLRGRYEVQINDDAGRALDALRMGGVYGFVRPYVAAAKPAGEWQTYDITLVGRRVWIALNGTTIADAEVIPGITGGALDSNEAAAGPIMLQGDHGPVMFRKIVLTPAQTAAQTAAPSGR